MYVYTKLYKDCEQQGRFGKRLLFLALTVRFPVILSNGHEIYMWSSPLYFYPRTDWFVELHKFACKITNMKTGFLWLEFEWRLIRFWTENWKNV